MIDVKQMVKVVVTAVVANTQRIVFAWNSDHCCFDKTEDNKKDRDCLMKRWIPPPHRHHHHRDGHHYHHHRDCHPYHQQHRQHSYSTAYDMIYYMIYMMLCMHKQPRDCSLHQFLVHSM